MKIQSQWRCSRTADCDGERGVGRRRRVRERRLRWLCAPAEGGGVRQFPCRGDGRGGIPAARIAELLFVDEHDLNIEQVGAVVGELRDLVDQFEAAFVEESHVETRDAVETPADIGDGLDEAGFFGADGLEEFFVGEDEGLVESGVVGGQADSAAGEGGFEGVETDFGFAFFGGGAGGFLRVFAVGGELGLGSGGFSGCLGGGLGSLLLDGAAVRGFRHGG